MAVLTMNRITVCGLREDRKAVLEILQRMGCIEVQDFVGEDDFFKKNRMPISASEFDRNIHDAENAISTLMEYTGEKAPGMLSSFHGRSVVETEKFDNFKDEFEEVSGIIADILRLSKENSERRAEIVKANQQIEMLVPWESLDVRMDLSGTEKTCIFIGALPGEWTLDKIYENLAGVLPVDVDIISTSKDQTCIMAVGEKQNRENLTAALRGIGFVYPSVSCALPPLEEKERLQGEIKRLEGEIEQCSEEIKGYNVHKDRIKFFADYQTIRAEKYNVINSLPQSEHTFILTGFTPEKYVPDIESALSDFDVCIETEKPHKKDDVPVLLSNNAFSESVQGVVESYALPRKGEIDPSFIISLFYFVFFGFMLSDAAIGLLLFVATLIILIRNPNMETKLRRNVKLFMFGGIAAMVFGVIFGSYFGDMVTVVSEEFFGVSVTIPPLWIDMQSNPMTVLTLALCLGIIHIFTGMAVAIYQFAKKKDYMSIIFDIVCWYFILGGLIVKAMSMQMIMDILLSGRDPLLSSTVGNIGCIFAGVGAVGVLFFAGRKSKNWGKRLLKGAYGIYGITSYLSDILSYSRLLALGLATGVISSVANMIGTMFGSGIIKVLVYLIVFVIINAINIGINTLGAYVHTNRLQYVEFFGRFYDGGSRAFQPYSIKTKYYKFKENVQ